MENITLKYEGDYLVVEQGQKTIASVKADENVHYAVERILVLLGLRPNVIRL